MNQEEVTQEELNKQHKSGLDSVDFINKILEKETLNEFDEIGIASNILHLYSLLEKYTWTTEQSELFLSTVLDIGVKLPELETEEKALAYFVSKGREYKGPAR